jgi:hypothetical protein
MICIEPCSLPTKRFITPSQQSYVSRMIFLVLWTRTRPFLELLDLSAAFDTVNHEILLHRIQIRLGIGGTVPTWLRSYLADRTQKVMINDTLSTPVHLPFDVPQRSFFFSPFIPYLFRISPKVMILSITYMRVIPTSIYLLILSTILLHLIENN